MSQSKLEWENEDLSKVAAHAQSAAKKGNEGKGNLLSQATDEVPANAARVPNTGKTTLGLLKQATSEVPAIAKSAAKSGKGG